MLQDGYLKSQSSPLYPPLKPGELRVFAVLETSPQLVLFLKAFKFEAFPAYYAISYCWGQQPTSRTAICNGRTIHVTPHLEAGIRSASIHMRAFFFWVDAISINQTDDAEKASQVAQMWRIFSSGRAFSFTLIDGVVADVGGVFVWLGVADNDSDTAMNCMNRFRVQNRHPRQAGGKYGMFSEAQWRALWHLFRRPYFTRLWIVQEIMLAKETYYCCGTRVAKAIDFEAIGKSMIYGKWRREIAEVPSDGVQRLLDPGYAATDFLGIIVCLRSPHKESLITMDLLIEVVQHQKALEPLDYVYGILCILPEKWRRRLKVDYSARSKENHLMVWAEFIKILIPGTDGRIFGLLESEQPKPPGLPSWCPDLSCPSRPNISIEYHAGGIFEGADRPDKEDAAVSMYSAPGSNAIQIEGSVVDEVINVHPLFVPDVLTHGPENGDLAQPWREFTDSLIHTINMVMRECAPSAADNVEQSTTTTSSTLSPSSFCRTFDFGNDITRDRARDFLIEQAQLTTPA